MKILILDDDFDRVKILKDRLGDAVYIAWAPDFWNFKLLVESCRYDLIMLDHDLGPCDMGELNGNDAAKFLAENRLLVGDDQAVVIHSSNMYGMANMVATMKHYDHLRINVIHCAWARCKYDITNERVVFYV